MNDKRCKGIDQRSGNVCIRGLPGLNVTCHSLGEEFHRQMQNLPHIGRTAEDCQLAAEFQAVDCLNPFGNELQCGKTDHHPDKRHEPFMIASRQQSVHKDFGHHRIKNAEQC